MNDKELLKIDNLTISFKKKITPVKNLNIENVRAGDLVVIVGSSGTGKSTILNAIAGFYRPRNNINRFLEFLEKDQNELAYEGKIYIDGCDVTSSSPSIRDVALVMQKTFLYNHLNVYKNIALPLSRNGESEQELKNKIESLLDKALLTKKMYEKISNLSGGQEQRVAIIKTIVRQPKIALLDEAFANLDPTNRALMINMITDELLSTNKTAVIYVTHNTSDLELADKIILLYKKNEDEMVTENIIIEGNYKGEAFEKMKSEVNHIFQRIIFIKK